MYCVFLSSLRATIAQVWRGWLIAGAVAACSPTLAQADVTTEISLQRGHDFYFVSLGLSATNPPLTFHWLESASGQVWRQFGDTNGASDFLLKNNLNDIIHECTNGLWKLYLNRGHPSEQLYQFSMSINNLTTETLGEVTIDFPADGSTGVTTTPTFHWSGPSNTLSSIYAYTAHQTSGNFWSAYLPGTATEWSPAALTPGPNLLLVRYSRFDFPGISFSTPTNALGAPISDWTGIGGLYSYKISNFSVAGGGMAAHSLKAHYTFDDNDFLGRDSSPSENHIMVSSSWGQPVHAYVADNIAGSGAIEFYGYSTLWLPTNLFPVLAGSFTVSAWIKTTQTFGGDDDPGFAGAGVIWGDLPGAAADVVPLALTGTKAAFFTGDPNSYSGNTLHSSTDVVGTGSYVHVAVTRNQITGEKKIYVNGDFEGASVGYLGALDALTDLGDLQIGGDYLHAYVGLLDDVQIYSGILSASEIAALYDAPGSTIPDVGGDSELADAVDQPSLLWITGGDAPWFRQTNETHDGMDAAQSGAIGHGEESWIETTVEGPGTLTFWWNVSSDDSDSYDYLELTVDGDSETELSGESGWEFYEVNLSAGTHTLRWTYHKDGDFTAGADAAWLDEVQFIPEIEMIMTLHIERSSDPTNPGFFAYPSITYVQPDPITAHEIVSPGNTFTTQRDGSGQDSISYSIQPTLATLITALEAGDWTIYINRGHPSERQYKFNVNVDTLVESDLPAVNVTSPTEWQTGVSTDHIFTWTGPGNYDSLYLCSYLSDSRTVSGGFTNLAHDVVSSTVPNPLMPGTNAVHINFTLNDFSGVTISDPEDIITSTPFSSWYAQVSLTSSQIRRFVVGAVEPPATPVQILNPWHTGTNFSLSLLTQAGRTHTVESRTNLTTAPWVNVTNFIGNGNTMQLFLPTATAPETYYRVATQ